MYIAFLENGIVVRSIHIQVPRRYIISMKSCAYWSQRKPEIVGLLSHRSIHTGIHAGPLPIRN